MENETQTQVQEQQQMQEQNQHEMQNQTQMQEQQQAAQREMQLVDLKMETQQFKIVNIEHKTDQRWNYEETDIEMIVKFCNDAVDEGKDKMICFKITEELTVQLDNANDNDINKIVNIYNKIIEQVRTMQRSFIENREKLITKFVAANAKIKENIE